MYTDLKELRPLKTPDGNSFIKGMSLTPRWLERRSWLKGGGDRYCQHSHRYRSTLMQVSECIFTWIKQHVPCVCVCVCVHWNTYTRSSVWIFFTLDLTSLICTQTSRSWDRWKRLMTAPSADCLEGKVLCGEEERDTVRLTLVAIAAL